MKYILTNLIKRIIATRGNIVLKKYEIHHLESKHIEAISQIYGFFKEEIFSNFSLNDKEIHLISRLYGTSIAEALYIIRYLRSSMKYDGQVCEFGVGNGATSTLLAFEILKSNKKLFLFDSFSGLSKPTKEDVLIDDMLGLGDIDKYEGTMSYTKEEVLRRIDRVNFPRKRLKIIPGFIDKTIDRKGIPNMVCFAYVDFDLYKPTKITLEYLDKVLVKGGSIIVDDYGYFSKGVMTAVDEFMKKRKAKYKKMLPKKFAGHFCMLQKR